MNDQMGCVTEQRAKTSWSGWRIFIHIGISGGIFNLVIATSMPGLDGNMGIRYAFELCIILLVALRYAWAALRHEQGRSYIPYVILLYLSTPLWLAAEGVYSWIIGT